MDPRISPLNNCIMTNCALMVCINPQPDAYPVVVL